MRIALIAADRGVLVACDGGWRGDGAIHSQETVDALKQLGLVALWGGWIVRTDAGRQWIGVKA